MATRRPATSPQPDGAKTSYIFVGNPGSGKSTLATLQAIRLTGKVGQYFESGVAMVDGLTVLSKPVDCGGGNFVLDTPGLDDVSKRKAAGEEIGKALRTGGNFKIMVIFSIPLFLYLFFLAGEQQQFRHTY